MLLKATPGWNWQKNEDTHKEKVPSNKTPALTKSMNIGI